MKSKTDTLHKKEPEVNDKSIDSLTKEVAKGGGITFIGRLATRIIGLIFNIIMARVLGPGSYGVYLLAATVTSICQSLSSVGFRLGVVRYVSIYEGEQNRPFLKGAIISGLLLSVSVSAILAFCLFLFSGYLGKNIFSEPDLTWVLKIFAYSLPFNAIIGIAGSVARAFRKIAYRTFLEDLFHPVTNVMFVSIAFLIGYSLRGAIYGIIFSAMISAVLGALIILKVCPDLLKSPYPVYKNKKMLKYSLPLFLAGITSLLLTRTDHIMLGIFGVSEDVGIYGVAAKMAFLLTFFVGSFNIVFGPQIADLYNRGDLSNLRALFQIVTKWIFTLTFPMFLVFVIFSRDIICIFGNNFTSGWKTLITLSAAKLITTSMGSLALILIMTGRQKLEFVNSIIVAVINVILNLALIPHYGKMGAAMAASFSLIIIAVIRLLEVKLLYKMHPFGLSFIKPLVAGLLCSVLLLGTKSLVPAFRFDWIIGIAYFVGIYLGIYLFLGIEKEDRVVISAIKKKSGWFKV